MLRLKSKLRADAWVLGAFLLQGSSPGGLQVACCSTLTILSFAALRSAVACRRANRKTRPTWVSCAAAWWHAVAFVSVEWTNVVLHVWSAAAWLDDAFGSETLARAGGSSGHAVNAASPQRGMEVLGNATLGNAGGSGHARQAGCGLCMCGKVGECAELASC